MMPLFARLAEEILRDVAIFHAVSKFLIRGIVAAQWLTKTTIRRLVWMDRVCALGRSRGRGSDLFLCRPRVPIARR